MAGYWRDVYMRNIECKLLHPEYGQTVPIPHYATDGSAAIDLPAMIDVSITIPPGSVRLIKTGLAVNTMDSNLAMILLPRSGLGHKNGIVLGNLIGLIDRDRKSTRLNSSHITIS